MLNMRQGLLVRMAWATALWGWSLAAFAAVLTPDAHLKADGIPPLEASIAEQVAPYTEFRGHSFVAWHPVERKMLVRHRAQGANLAQLYELDAPGGKFTQVTDFPDSVRAASYHPVHGKYLVFARDTGGNEAAQIYRMDLPSREVTLLSQADERSGYRWMNSGQQLLIASVPLDKTASGGKREAPGTTLTLVDPLQPSKRRRLAELPATGWGDFRFSEDDRQLAATVYRSPSDSEVVLMDVATGERQKLLPLAGQPKAGFGELAWSRDGKTLYVTSNQGGEFLELVAFDLAQRSVKVLSRHIPWNLDSIRVSPDGLRLLVVANHNGRDEVRVFDTSTGAELGRPSIPVGSIAMGDWHRAGGGVFAFSLNSPQSPGDAYTYDLNTGRMQRWTTAYADPRVDPATFASPELVEIKGFDGLPLSGWLYLPDAKKFPGRRPVLMDFHGGPEGQSTVHFMGRWNYYLNELGLAILLPNVRGSAGYGKSFLALDNGFKRKDSVKDGGAFLSWLAKHPRLDSGRVVVSGGSYGGYMSLAMAVDYGSQLKGAIDVVGISHFVTFLNNTESYRRDLRRAEYGDERDPKMRAFMEEIAPLNNAKAIKVPLFVVQGKNDPRVPYTEAEQIVAAVRANQVPAWYLLADNEGHGFVRKVNADYYFYSTVKFFQETLLK